MTNISKTRQHHADNMSVEDMGNILYAIQTMPSGESHKQNLSNAPSFWRPAPYSSLKPVPGRGIIALADKIHSSLRSHGAKYRALFDMQDTTFNDITPLIAQLGPAISAYRYRKNDQAIQLNATISLIKLFTEIEAKLENLEVVPLKTPDGKTIHLVNSKLDSNGASLARVIFCLPFAAITQDNEALMPAAINKSLVDVPGRADGITNAIIEIEKKLSISKPPIPLPALDRDNIGDLLSQNSGILNVFVRMNHKAKKLKSILNDNNIKDDDMGIAAPEDGIYILKYLVQEQHKKFDFTELDKAVADLIREPEKTKLLPFKKELDRVIRTLRRKPYPKYEPIAPDMINSLANNTLQSAERLTNTVQSGPPSSNHSARLANYNSSDKHRLI